MLAYYYFFSPPRSINRGRKYNMMTCKHFGECGGCRFLDREYHLQLGEKDELCRRLLEDAGIKTDLREIIPSPQPFYYRNKMEFTFYHDGGELVCGLHRRDKNRSVFQLEECLLFSEDLPLIMNAVMKFARASGLPAYHPYRHEGFWRNLVVREGKFTGQIMVNLVTSSEGKIDDDALRQAFEGLPTERRIISLIHTVNDSLSNAVIPERVSILRGDPFYEEKLFQLSFRIPPFSFFQVNPFIMNVFYPELHRVLDLKGSEKILDIFCGGGTIGLVLSSRAESILGIELDETAVENARSNARLNQVGNLSFIAGKASRVMVENREDWPGQFDLVVVNPPRSGITKKVVKRILEINPERVVYSSCNPKTFFPQAGMLLESYHLEIIQPFDFFPQTPHMELLAVFRRNQSL
jgi:23S rRNA (uracil1939-C5)-methyltransferase